MLVGYKEVTTFVDFYETLKLLLEECKFISEAFFIWFAFKYAS